MAEMSRLLALEEEIEFGGKIWKLAPLTFEIQAKFGQWLKKQAYQELVGLREMKLLTDQQFEADKQSLYARFAAKEYEFFSRNASIALANPLSEGFRQMLLLRLKPNHPEADDKLVWEFLEQKLDGVMFAMRGVAVQEGEGADPTKEADASLLTPSSTS